MTSSGAQHRVGDQVIVGGATFEVVDTKGRRVLVQPVDGGMPTWVPAADCKPARESAFADVDPFLMVATGRPAEQPLPF